MTNGTTYMVRPRIDAANSGRSLAYAWPDSIQLLVGPAMRWIGRANERELLGAGDVVGIAAVQVAARKLVLIERDEDATGDSLADQFLLFLRAAVEDADVLRAGIVGTLGHPLAHRDIGQKRFGQQAAQVGRGSHDGRSEESAVPGPRGPAAAHRHYSTEAGAPLPECFAGSVHFSHWVMVIADRGGPFQPLGDGDCRPRRVHFSHWVMVIARPRRSISAIG